MCGCAWAAGAERTRTIHKNTIRGSCGSRWVPEVAVTSQIVASFISWVEEALCVRWPSLASQMHARSDGHGAAPRRLKAQYVRLCLGCWG